MYCKGCQTEKGEGAFYAGNRSRCKDCVRAAVTASRLANIERVRAYDRMRGSMPHRVAARAEYRKTAAHAESHEAAVARWQAKHPERRKANTALGNAIRDGHVAPWPVCAVPACDCKPEAHHPDYSRPLDVVWLCSAHHKQAHALVANDSQERKVA